MKNLVFVLFHCLIIHNSFAQNTPKGVIAQNAMVVSAHPEASRIGLEILKKGGNAFDAAIATEFALAVCLPVAGNIGGGGFMVFRKANGEIGALDYREKAPAQAKRDMYLDKAGNPIEGLSLLGHLACGVPGTVDGMVKIHQRYSSLVWKDLVQPAIDLARNGVVLTEREAEGLNRNRESFLKYNTYTPHLVAAQTWKKGDIIKHEDLAKTLERIRDYGRDGFYAGQTAFLIVRELQKRGGIISLQDLQNYQAVWRRPLTSNYKGHRIITMCPPSSGGIGILQMLGMLESYDLKKMGWNTTKTVQLMAEAERRFYADRANYLGDADFFPVPVDNLIDKKYLRSRFKDFSFAKASKSSETKFGTFNSQESEETTHYSIVDAQGNAVAITTTLNGGYGSKVVVEGAGFLLNNEMDDFSIKPNTPNYYGAVGGEANAIEPNKRMLSSMTPTIVEKNGKLLMVVGTPGGTTIITSVFQVMLNVIEHGYGIQEAVNAKRFHHQHLPDEIFVEDDNTFSTQTKAELEKLGYKIIKRGAIGRVDAILRLPDGTLEGGADPRGDDKAVGY